MKTVENNTNTIGIRYEKPVTKNNSRIVLKNNDIKSENGLPLVLRISANSMFKNVQVHLADNCKNTDHQE